MVLGDPAGTSPELVARLLADTEVREKAHIVLIADEVKMRHDMYIVGCEFSYRRIDVLETLDFADVTPLLHPWLSQGRDEFPRNEASAAGGRYSLETLAPVLGLVHSGRTGAILFGPLNKTSLHMTGIDHSDESHWFAKRLGFDGPFRGLSVLDDLWTSRVTSHVTLAEAPGLSSRERIEEVTHLIDGTLRHNGLVRPRIGVCGLNPRDGDNNSFGRGELDVIALAVQKVCEQGIAADGPCPAGTIFPEVQGDARVFDAVVIMYHDQGQIAIRLMGSSRGATVRGSLSIPITMPAHGTASDIAGQGRANVGATRQTLEIACWMGRYKA